MKFLDEYRQPLPIHRMAARIAATATRPWTLMEVCGGQTHSIVKHGLQALLPEEITLLHGPGCPVCVTPAERIDRALDLARTPDVTLCTFGDMLRVPGSRRSLLSAKAAGADVSLVYSPLDALDLAARNRDRQVVFFAVGFETTAPTTAMTVRQAQHRGLDNFTLLVSHVLVPPALEAIASSPHCRVNAFLAAGHVCTVVGFEEYVPLAPRLGTPIVVTGFEPLDILDGIRMAIQQLEDGRTEVENQYARVVRRGGNSRAQAAVGEVFEVASQEWRGIGQIPQSGLRLTPAYADFDADRRFFEGAAFPTHAGDPQDCIAGQVLQGLQKPVDCPAFGTRCTPETPVGAPMVSSEGACAAYYRYAEIASR